MRGAPELSVASPANMPARSFHRRGFVSPRDAGIAESQCRCGASAGLPSAGTQNDGASLTEAMGSSASARSQGGAAADPGSKLTVGNIMALVRAACLSKLGLAPVGVEHNARPFRSSFADGPGAGGRGPQRGVLAE